MMVWIYVYINNVKYIFNICYVYKYMVYCLNESMEWVRIILCWLVKNMYICFKGVLKILFFLVFENFGVFKYLKFYLFGD